MDDKLIDQSKVAKTVSDKIPYEFSEFFLVKPLPPIMVKKEIEEPVGENQEKDTNGVEAIDYEVKKEIKEVEANYKKGIVLKTPIGYEEKINDPKFPSLPISIGDIIVYRYGQYFDILKDTMLIRTYDVIAVEHKTDAEV